MAKIARRCLFCDDCFDADLREVNRGNAKFCNKNCFKQYQNQNPRLKIKVPNACCAYCGDKFYLSQSKLNSKSGLLFCCRKHKDLAQRIGGCKEIQPPHYNNVQSDYRLIVFRDRNIPKICERCGYHEHDAAIIVHHRDRDRKNNCIDNLEVLCCNCHAIEHFGGVAQLGEH